MSPRLLCKLRGSRIAAARGPNHYTPASHRCKKGRADGPPAGIKTAIPDSGWWIATVPELAGCLTQGRTIEQARERIREAIAAVLDLRNDYAGRLVDDVRLPAKVKRTVRSAEQARKKAQRAERVASEKIREATAELGKLGMSLRDVGTLLGVSRQRAQQLARK